MVVVEFAAMVSPVTVNQVPQSGSIYLDFAKTGAGVVLGFFLGLIAEPIKARIKARAETREAEKLIIDDISSLARQSLSLVELYRAARSGIIGNELGSFAFRIDRHSHLLQHDSAALFRIKGYEIIRRFFESFKSIEGRSLSSGKVGNLLFEFIAIYEAIQSKKLPRTFKTLIAEGDFMKLINELHPKLKPQPSELPAIDSDSDE